MYSALSFFVKLIPLLLALASAGYLLWLWLRRSAEPMDLIGRWVITLVILLPVLGFAARAHDETMKIAAVLVGAFGGIILAVVWGPKMCEFVADALGSLYTGGNQQADPTPFYSIAEAKRKRGQYAEAIEEIQKQLDSFSNDFTGWMMIAEIQADNLQDLASARQTVDLILAQEGHAPKNIAYILNRRADWELKFAQDREAARLALERILELLPDTEQAQLALQRIAHLTPPEMLADKQEPRRMALLEGVANLGLQQKSTQILPAEKDPGLTAAEYVRHLEQFPHDADTREKLALIYARHYQRLDLATDQLEQLITFPNQPPKQVVRWLNLLADLQIELTGDINLARQSLQRIIDLYPKSAAAESAANRLAYLKLELRPKRTSQAIKLGSYEQNIGLKGDWK
jgi:tetratricopeptide (TPR) repeat protein